MVVVGLLTIEIALAEGSSLKDKRHVVRSTLDQVRHKFNISAAEVGHLDSIRSAELAFAAVANERGFMNSVLDRVLQFIESDPRITVVESELEIL